MESLHGFNIALLFVAVLIVVSVLSTIFSFRAGAPILLVFLAVGFLAGEDGIGGFDFDNADIAFKVGSVALALILFDSGFGTPLRAFRSAAAPALTLATFGVLLTALVFGVAAHFALGLRVWWYPNASVPSIAFNSTCPTRPHTSWWSIASAMTARY